MSWYAIVYLVGLFPAWRLGARVCWEEEDQTGLAAAIVAGAVIAATWPVFALGFAAPRLGKPVWQWWRRGNKQRRIGLVLLGESRAMRKRRLSKGG